MNADPDRVDEFAEVYRSQGLTVSERGAMAELVLASANRRLRNDAKADLSAVRPLLPSIAAEFPWEYCFWHGRSENEYPLGAWLSAIGDWASVNTRAVDSAEVLKARAGPLDSALPAAPETPPYFYPVVPEPVRYGAGMATRIGRDNFRGETLLLDSGEVVQFRNGYTLLINSSLDAFRESLILMGEAMEGRDIDRTPIPQLESDAKLLERRMRGVDPRGWARSVGTCWPFVVEEMGYGLI